MKILLIEDLVYARRIERMKRESSVRQLSVDSSPILFDRPGNVRLPDETTQPAAVINFPADIGTFQVRPISDRPFKFEADVEADVVSETFDALRTLGHGESHARKLIDEALARKKTYKTVESLLQAIYDQSHA